MSRRRVPKPVVKREPCERCKGRRWLISEAPEEMYGGKLISRARRCSSCGGTGSKAPLVADGKAQAYGDE